MEFSSALGRGRHSEELKELSDTKDYLLDQAKKKQASNTKIFAEIKDLSQEFSELDSMLSDYLKETPDPDIMKEVQILKREYEQFNSTLQQKKQLCQTTNIEKICQEIEELYKSILETNQLIPHSDSSHHENPSKPQENLLDLKTKTDKTKNQIFQTEQEYSKELQELETLKKEFEALMKLKHLKEFEIKTLIKREEHERKVYDEHLDELTEQKKVHRSILAYKKPEKKIQLSTFVSPNIQPPPQQSPKDSFNTLFLLLTAVCLLIGITFYF